MANTFRLVVQNGPGIGTEYAIEKNEVILGRDAGNDIVINDPEISRRHLRLTLDGNTYRIEDLGSTNGTFINGQRLAAPFVLRPNEVITLGEKVVLRFASMADSNATVIAPRHGGSDTQSARPLPPVAAPPAPQPVTPIYSPPAPVQPVAPVAPVYQPAPVTPIPVAPVYQPAPVAPIPVAPAYPAGVQGMPLQPIQQKKKISPVLIILLIVGLLIVIGVIGLILIDATSSYCSVIPGITNLIYKLFFGGAVACP